MKKLIAILSAFIIVFSCQQEKDEPQPTDVGYLSIAINITVTSEEADGRTEAVDTDSFRVTIFDAGGTEIMVFDPFSSAPAEVALPTGEYYVEAHSNNLVDAAFDNPFYFGRSVNFTIDKEETKTVDIVPELANTKVAILYSGNVTNTFNSYTGSVTVISSGASLFYDQGETREGYFVTSPLEVAVNLSYTKLDGTTIDRTFTTNIDDPQPKTLYNIRVDAELADGVIIFNITVDESFDTIDIELGDADPNANWIPGGDWTDTRDNEVYRTVQIGRQVWMTEHLRYLPEVHSNAELIVQSDAELPAYGVYDYDGSDVSEAIQLPNYQTYGVTYNWYAAMDQAASSDTNPSGVQGACPVGWHVPSDSEWLELGDTLGGIAIAGGKMKHAGFDYWRSPNTGATNESGFNGLPAGYRLLDGTHTRMMDETLIWSATDTNLGTPGLFTLDWQTEDLERREGNKKAGFSVRCVKDY